jgi:hypothetical protein
MAFSTCIAVSTSQAAVGSSNNNIVFCSIPLDFAKINAHPIATLCLSPPDRLDLDIDR